MMLCLLMTLSIFFVGVVVVVFCLESPDMEKYLISSKLEVFSNIPPNLLIVGTESQLDSPRSITPK